MKRKWLLNNGNSLAGRRYSRVSRDAMRVPWRQGGQRALLCQCAWRALKAVQDCPCSTEREESSPAECRWRLLLKHTAKAVQHVQ